MVAMLCECFTAGRPLVPYRSSFICIIETLACIFSTDLANMWPEDGLLFSAPKYFFIVFQYFILEIKKSLKLSL